MKLVIWPYVTGSNSMSRGLAWRSVTDKLDHLGIEYKTVENTARHSVAMSGEDFLLFALQWNNKGLRHLQWQAVNLPDAQE